MAVYSDSPVGAKAPVLVAIGRRAGDLRPRSLLAVRKRQTFYEVRKKSVSCSEF